MPFWPLTTLLSTTTTTHNTTLTTRKRPASPTSPNHLRKRPRVIPSLPPNESRFNPLITPTSPDFLAAHAYFTSLLSDPSQSVSSILVGHFPEHEVLLLQAWDGKSGGMSRAVREMRRGNRWVYGELMRSARWKGWEGGKGVGFKLAVAWFGVPVANLGGEDPPEEKIEEEGDGEGQELGFLNGYLERGFERDLGVREPDPVMETYYTRGNRQQTWTAPEFHLRGGGDFDGQEEYAPSDMSDDDEDMHTESTQLYLRGSAAQGEPVSNIFRELHDSENSGGRRTIWSSVDKYPTMLRTDLGGITSSDTGKHWLPMYGYQGVVWFCMDRLYTFVDAIDRLLCLDNRAGVTYSLYLFDKSKDYSSEAERDDFLSELTENGLTMSCGGAGDYSRDQLAWEWVGQQLGADLHSHALFVAGPGDPIPWTWEPGPSHRIAKVVLYWPSLGLADRPDVAYLRMPENPADAVFINDYAPSMAHVCRVLAFGLLPGRPGYPAIPDAWFTVQGLGRKFPQIGSYGGLAFLPQLWEAIVREWQKDPAKAVVLEARTAPEADDGISDRWHIFLPGADCPYDKQYIPHRDADHVDGVRMRITALLKSTMSGKSFSALERVEVHLPGNGMFLPSSKGRRARGLVIATTGKNLNTAFQPLSDLLTQWKQWLEKKPGVYPAPNGLALFPQFLSIRPVFGEYTLYFLDVDREVSWDPGAITLEQFRQLLADVLEGYSPATSWVGLGQGFQSRFGTGLTSADHTANKPRLLVGPKTTERGWNLMCQMIVEPFVSLMMVPEHTFARFGDNAEQPFGYRDIYETPDWLLYGDGADGESQHRQHHYDWQLWQKNVSTSLVTVQPWEKQPKSLSEFYVHEEFPLQLPPGTERAPSITAPSTGGPATRAPTQPLTTKPKVRFQDPPGMTVPEAQTIPAAQRTPVAQTTPAAQTIPAAQRTPVTQTIPAARTTPPARTIPPARNIPPTKTIPAAHNLREYSYAHPLNVHMTNSIPINAPPIDALLDLNRDSLPIVSLPALTPSEARRLQRDYHDMRNIVLSRAVRCPYEGCGAVLPANQPAAMQAHLSSRHVAEKCNFCSELLFVHWSPQQRYRHFVTEHAALLRTFVIPQSDYAVQVAAEGKTNRALEGAWRFCPRCGRDHSALDVPADRAHHDSVCYPGVQHREGDWAGCAVCGEHVAVGADGAPVGEHVHFHWEGVEDERPFCGGCALPLGRFSGEYKVKHRGFCNGHGRDDGRFCPWCGVDLGDDLRVREAHVGACEKRAAPGYDDPLNTATREYFVRTPVGQEHPPAGQQQPPAGQQQPPAGQQQPPAGQQQPPAGQQQPPTGQQQEPRSPKRKRPKADGAPETQTPPKKKTKPNIAPIETTRTTPGSSSKTPAGSSKTKPTTRRASDASSALSSPPSTSHSKRSSKAWLPPKDTTKTTTKPGAEEKGKGKERATVTDTTKPGAKFDAADKGKGKEKATGTVTDGKASKGEDNTAGSGVKDKAQTKDKSKGKDKPKPKPTTPKAPKVNATPAQPPQPILPQPIPPADPASAPPLQAPAYRTRAATRAAAATAAGAAPAAAPAPAAATGSGSGRGRGAKTTAAKGGKTKGRGGVTKTTTAKGGKGKGKKGGHAAKMVRVVGFAERQVLGALGV